MGIIIQNKKDGKELHLPSSLLVCGFRGKAVTIPKLIRSAFRN
jgi:hypothetical protein